jgi:exodeoxyribonuclease VII large subunit
MTGAAIHDIVTTLRSRMRQVRIIVRPVRVQGRYAGADIAIALAELTRVAGVEVIIVGRGGGSLEDLWAFNEERVARAIAAATVPVVSAVGHEIDVTLADLAADCRAATPTAAAALVVPDCAQLGQRLRVREIALAAAMRAHLRRTRERTAALARHIRDPRRHVAAQRQYLADLSDRAQRALCSELQRRRARLAADAERLHALSPLAVLERGYAIARRADGALVRSSRDLAVGDALDLTFAAGGARVRVESRGD